MNPDEIFYVDSTGAVRRDWIPGEYFLDAGVPTDAGEPPTPEMPLSLRIGFKTYEVQPWPAVSVVDDASVGRCEHYASVIRVAVEGRPPADVAETLLHEILHACWYVARLEDAPPEEKVVSTLASVLGQVFRDNPDLMAYLDGTYFSLPES